MPPIPSMDNVLLWVFAVLQVKLSKNYEKVSHSPTSSHDVNPSHLSFIDTCTIDDNCHKKDEQQNVSGHSRSTVAMDGSHTKEHATTMFQNPLDRWIPRRFGLGRPTGQRKHVRIGVKPDAQILAPENSLMDRLVIFPDTSGRISSDEY